MCLNNHKIMYFIVCLWIMIIIYYFNMIFSVIICFNNCVMDLLNKQLQCSNLAFILFSFFMIEYTLNKYSCLLNHNLMQTMGFWFLLHLLAHCFFILLCMSCGFGASLIIWQFTKCFNTLFLNFYGTHVCSLGVVHSHLGGFMNYVDSKLPRVTKYFANKSFTKLVKKCFRINFFKLAHSLKKSMACVNIAQL